MAQRNIRRKANPSILANLEAKVVHQRKQVAIADEIVKLEESPGWSRVKDMVEGRIKAIDQILVNFESLSDEERVIYLKERKDMNYFAHILDDFKHDLPALNDALAAATKMRDEYKARIDG